MAHDVGSRRTTVNCLAGLAGVLSAAGRPEVAARVLGALEQSWRDVAPYAGQPWDRAYVRAEAATRAMLIEEAFAQAWNEGQALSLDQAVDEALRATAPTTEQPSQPA